jgi:hypothetical protein
MAVANSPGCSRPKFGVACGLLRPSARARDRFDPRAAGISDVSRVLRQRPFAANAARPLTASDQIGRGIRGRAAKPPTCGANAARPLTAPDQIGRRRSGSCYLSPDITAQLCVRSRRTATAPSPGGSGAAPSPGELARRQVPRADESAYMFGQLCPVPPGARLGDERLGAGVGAGCVVLAVLDVDDVAALAIAAPPAASEPTIVRVARAAAIRCRMLVPSFLRGPLSQLAMCRRSVRQT